LIEIISEYIVHEADRGQFELVFARGGAWSKLFARQRGFRGTSLLRDEEDPGRYLIIDFWDSSTDWKDAIAESQSEYSELMATLSTWTQSKARLGIFEIHAEGTVRPIEKPRPRRHRPPHQP